MGACAAGFAEEAGSFPVLTALQQEFEAVQGLRQAACLWRRKVWVQALRSNRLGQGVPHDMRDIMELARCMHLHKPRHSPEPDMLGCQAAARKHLSAHSIAVILQAMDGSKLHVPAFTDTMKHLGP